MQAYRSLVYAENVSFHSNVAGIQGGGVSLQALFIASKFVANMANSTGGGGLHHTGSAVTLNSSTFVGNTAGSDSFSDSWSNAGGGVFGQACTGPMEMINSTALSNVATGRGGAVVALSCAVSLTGTQLKDNTAQVGVTRW
ncbi:hypothetical protein TSOC_001129 [Tetrabaena socialis]|uniref:Right handed beta helix domain-containing protein n=1 Tax=Tetrabaena socialis TaxID=47790 RepID=A0A2J8AHK8_9CHLO|nr:hypothetical protein TSOC_001129 [Tetrabaena socialis]|eukprot:PNH12002.1 hypothetical protein TSOC_001129 [Tetrabaena socialis]